jgi:DNA modification methylase
VREPVRVEKQVRKCGRADVDAEGGRVSDERQTMRIEDVRVPNNRWRRAHHDPAPLAASIDALGILHPITVTTEGVLVAGLHRLEACTSLGWERIAVHVVTLDELDRELAEIDENLLGPRLTVLERGELLARKKAIHEAKYPETKHGGAPGKAGGGKVAGTKDPDSGSFVDDAAAKTGRGRSTIHEDVQIATCIPDDLRDELRETKFADNKSVLLDVARIDDAAEQRVVTEMLVTGAARNVPQARRRYAEEQRTSVKAPEDPDCRVILGDCVHQVSVLDVRPACVVADPPYGIDVHNTRRGEQDYADGAGYAFDLIERLCAELVQKCLPDAHLYFFSGYTHAHRMKEILLRFFEVQDNPLIWEKGNHTMCDFAQWYPSKHEYVWFAKQRGSTRRLAKCVPDVLPCKLSRDSTHSAEKPVDLLATLIEQSTVPGELVLDPFCGSGSTGVACKRLSRAFVGIESDTHWVEVARARVAA